ncbi:N-acetyltransferase GCN5 [Vreelandella aquamarina]|jgi:GNAT superfamily N-acetyltransferase|uniref:GNAT family N-acetyltransferase n=2 Tax=Vreelandella TaxID=3137766 RepID=A0A7Z0RVR5_9GAMM|nr:MULTISPECIES: GNAT family N-acetyltransferase [Halomonas]MCD1652161.1 GNAT family N-acetyltransferase [Halomonas axialensis]MCD2088683.1 GNAT family N-acetyltransferase [Halomonas meridiana]NYS61868.1 GNAT family N-acetyltransferase [Halomonas salicampi]CDG56079.1 N-acetyltransferase GCN5 [Halomonas sp. A3H3]SIN83991.1 Acetyltransferase (GNAT) domain-containing protein [Halomonas meridiana]|tara:strand:+ start:76 stop:597 length:522 start_codon:yes stop_codon:yes gene_type:complete
MCSEADEPKETLDVKIKAPEKLGEHHDISEFDCGRPSLNDFLKLRALKNARRRATVTYVVCYESGDQVAGYISLATGAVMRQSAPKRMQRNMPTEIPVVVLGRLAVDQRCQGIGLGADLLAEAVDRALAAAEHVAVRALLVHALDEEAAAFYKRHGFIETPFDPMVLMLSLSG